MNILAQTIIPFANPASVSALPKGSMINFINKSGCMVIGKVVSNNLKAVTVSQSIPSVHDNEEIEIAHEAAMFRLFKVLSPVGMSSLDVTTHVKALADMGHPVSVIGMAKKLGCHEVTVEKALCALGLHKAKNEHGFKLEGLNVKEVPISCSGMVLEVLVQTPTENKVVHYAGEDINDLYNQCASNPMVKMFEFKRVAL
jgi:hypothetical protein